MANESIKNEDFDIMCRICLQRSDDRIDLFSSLAGYSMISNAVMECAPIQVIFIQYFLLLFIPFICQYLMNYMFYE